VVTRQQTPKPAAHDPEADPDLDVHSVEVKQVPVRLEAEVQASFGNWTIEKRPMGLGAEWTSPHKARVTKYSNIVVLSIQMMVYH